MSNAGDEDSKMYDRSAEEWKTCREAINRFDDILIDLRKFGFSFLTGLTTAGSFLGFASPEQNLQIGVIVVTMILVMVLYWLDLYYQNLLYGAMFRGRFLEIFKLNRGLGVYISAFYGAAKIGRILHFLYVGFLIGLFVLGLFAIDFFSNVSGLVIPKEVTDPFIILLGAFIVTLIGIITLYVLCDRKRTKTVRDTSSLIKEYREFCVKETDEGIKNLMINTLEKKLMNIFEKYL